MNVVIVGQVPFVDDIGRLCRLAGHDAALYLAGEFTATGEQAERLAAADVAIELQDTSAAAKHALLRALGARLSPEALLLTSALAGSATAAAAGVPRPERVVGFGVVPPVAEAGLVEVAAALQTGDEALTRAEWFWRGLGLEPVRVADGPGLVRARTVCCLINEAAGLLLEGVATAADIDLAMRLGTNYPHGPLAWADLIGLDVILGVMNGLFEEWGEDRYRPSPLLRRLVAAGRLGRKTGQGFYPYPDD